jgi:hypothetical protein
VRDGSSNNLDISEQMFVFLDRYAFVHSLVSNYLKASGESCLLRRLTEKQQRLSINKFSLSVTFSVKGNVSVV